MLCVIFAQVYKLQFAYHTHHDLKKRKKKGMSCDTKLHRCRKLSFVLFNPIRNNQYDAICRFVSSYDLTDL